MKTFEQFIDFDDFSEEEIFGKEKYRLIQDVTCKYIYILQEYDNKNLIFYKDSSEQFTNRYSFEIDGLDKNYIYIHDPKFEINNLKRYEGNERWIKCRYDELPPEIKNKIEI